MTSLDPLERVVSALARDPNLHRVKKLLYCACYGVWEDDTQRLNQVSLQEIVQGVWERSPTLEALQFQLNRVVKTLNKPVAYAHVANGVLQVLGELYLNTYDITRPVIANRVQLSKSVPGSIPGGYDSGQPTAATGHQDHDILAEYARASELQMSQPPVGQAPVDYAPSRPAQPESHQPSGGLDDAETRWFIGGEQESNASGLTPAQLSAQTAVRAHVLRSLSEHSEQRRMKKLLVCVCHNQWENDRSHLAALDWEQLLDDVRQLLPTLPGLDHALQAIVNSLSKPVEYLRVAQLLLEIVTPLYEQERPDETQFFGVIPEPNAPEPNTRLTAPNSARPQSWRTESSHPGAIASNQVAPNQAAPSQAAPTYPPAVSVNGQAPAPPEQFQTGVVNRGTYATPPARRTSDSWPHPPALNAAVPQASSASTFSQGSDSGEHNEEPETGLFAPQLPPSPMDQKYPPRAVPERSPMLVGEPEPHGRSAESAVVESAVVENTVAITQVVAPLGDSPEPASSGSSTQTRSHEAKAVENDGFTLRLTLMRYANPLMAKVVMFSALHHLFRFGEQDWAELHHHSLDSLVAGLEARYPNFIDLEVKLCGVAEQLEVPEQAMQTVAALLKVLKPRYDAAAQAPARELGRAIAQNASPARSAGAPATPSANAARPKPAERATAIQFGPEASRQAAGQADTQDSGSNAAIALQAAQSLASSQAGLARAVSAEVLPADDTVYSALISSNDLEADLALLAASLEDDGLSHPLEP